MNKPYCFKSKINVTELMSDHITGHLSSLGMASGRRCGVLVKANITCSGNSHEGHNSPLFFDRAKWTVIDITTHQHILSTHEALLLDLYDKIQYCYNPKPSTIGSTMYVFENHVQDDASFPKTSEDLKAFSDQLHEGPQNKAHNIYRTMLEEKLPQDQYSWEYFHVIEFRKAVIALA